MKNKLFYSIIDVAVLCVLILIVSSYFIHNSSAIGWIIIFLGFICLATLIPFGIKLRCIWPDIVFGMIDNGILAGLAIFGGEIGGVIGAIIGGVVGNAVTDGVAGIFEGWIAEKSSQDLNRRSLLGASIGKMSGCLIAGGAVLAIAGLMKN
jgi:hypothetical protein